MSNIVTTAKTENLNQRNASRIEALFDVHEFVHQLLKPMIDASTVHHHVNTNNVFEDGASEVTDAIDLLFGEPNLGIVSLIATNNGKQVNEVLGIYPVVKGATQKVKIEKVIVWNTQICATILCSKDDFLFAFFATDFYRNKEKYIESEFLDINLAALACNTEEAERGFSFEGQNAIDWLAKIGEEPSYNEDGSVRPVNFSMEQLAVYLATEPKAPDEAQFQSPVCMVENFSFIGMAFYRTYIIIRGEGAEFQIPIILRKDLIPNLEEGMPIRGIPA